MAGDWIKVEENMPDKPEVWQIADILKLDGDAVAGKLLRVWAWATRNCNGDGVTSVTSIPAIDRLSGVTGFANAMIRVGWLNSADGVLSFPKFGRHCSQTAKERANTNRRVANHRNNSNADTVTDVTDEALQKPLPEKRREEKKEEIHTEGQSASPLPVRVSKVFIPPSPEEVEAYSQEIGYPLNGEAWCNSYAQKGWMVGKSKMKDWKAAVRNWKTSGYKIGHQSNQRPLLTPEDHTINPLYR